MILKMILIPMLIKTLLVTRKPHWCALLYGAALFTNSLMFDLAFKADWGKVLFVLAGATGLSYAVFWALKEFEDTALYWVALVIGVGLLLWFF